MEASHGHRRGGSFLEARAYQRILFDESVRRHDRDWPHSPLEAGKNVERHHTNKRPKRGWKIVGIFHFPHGEEDGEGDEVGNAGSC